MWTYKLKSIYKKVTNNINKPMNYLQNYLQPRVEVSDALCFKPGLNKNFG